MPDSIVVRSVLVDSNATTYIGCTGLEPSGSDPFYGVYKSIDQGANWLAVGLLDTSIMSLKKMDNIGNIYGYQASIFTNQKTKVSTGNYCQIVD